METTIVYWGYIRVMLGLYRDNGKENGNNYSRLDYIGFRVWGSGSRVPPTA